MYRCHWMTLPLYTVNFVNSPASCQWTERCGLLGETVEKKTTRRGNSHTGVSLYFLSKSLVIHLKQLILSWKAEPNRLAHLSKIIHSEWIKMSAITASEKVDGFTRKSMRKAQKQKKSQGSSQFRTQSTCVELSPLPQLKGKRMNGAWNSRATTVFRYLSYRSLCDIPDIVRYESPVYPYFFANQAPAELLLTLVLLATILCNVPF